MKKTVFMVLSVLIAFVLQSTVFHLISFGGITPNLLIIITCVFGFMCGQTPGLLVGFFAGLLYDIFYGNILCFYALIFMYVGFLNGYFKQIFYKEDIKLPILLIVSSDMVYGIMIYVLQFLLRGRFHFGYYFMHLILPEMVYTVLMTLLLYPIMRWVNNKLDDLDQRSEDTFA